MVATKFEGGSQMTWSYEIRRRDGEQMGIKIEGFGLPSRRDAFLAGQRMLSELLLNACQRSTKNQKANRAKR
jgi:hypothetical protein